MEKGKIQRNCPLPLLRPFPHWEVDITM